jgi:hypothetical protein
MGVITSVCQGLNLYSRAIQGSHQIQRLFKALNEPCENLGSKVPLLIQFKL